MLKFSSPLLRGKLIKRYKRFLASVILEDGSEIVAHCPNTGSMQTCWNPGDTVYLSHNPSPKRKLAYTWEFTETAQGLIGINTHRPNRVVENTLVSRGIPELAGYDLVDREVKVGSSRLDFRCRASSGKLPDCYVEVKNVTLFLENQLQFPDAVSSRGLKHLQELTDLVGVGYRSVLFFLANRAEGSSFRVASHIDPAYDKGLQQAIAAGVEVLVYRCRSTLVGMTLGESLNFSSGMNS